MMSKRLLIVFTLILVLLSSGFNVNAVEVDALLIERDGYNKCVVVTENHVVWLSYSGDGSFVKKYDLDTGETAILNSAPDHNVNYYRSTWVSDDYVCWSDYRNCDYDNLKTLEYVKMNDMFAASLTNGVEFMVSDPDAIFSTYAAVSENHLAFTQFFPEDSVKKSGLYYVDLNNPSEMFFIQETNDSPRKAFLCPILGNGHIVWSVDRDLFLFDIVTKTIEIIDDNVRSPTCSARIANNYLYYKGFGDDVYYYDLTTKENGQLLQRDPIMSYRAYNFGINPNTDYLMYEHRVEGFMARNLCIIKPGMEKPIIVATKERGIGFLDSCINGDDAIFVSNDEDNSYLNRYDVVTWNTQVLKEVVGNHFSKPRSQLVSVSTNGSFVSWVHWAMSENIEDCKYNLMLLER